MYRNKPYRGVYVPIINNPDATAATNQKNKCGSRVRNKCLSRIRVLKTTMTPNSVNTAVPSEIKGVDSIQLYRGAKNALKACVGEYVRSLNRSTPRTLRMLCVLADHDSNIWKEASPAARVTAPPATAKCFQHLNRSPCRRLLDDRATHTVPPPPS